MRQNGRRPRINTGVATVLSDLVAVALCLGGSGFFSASETALTSLPITRLEAMRLRCGPLTRAGLDRWAEAPQELLITILVGNNLVNVLASALATKIAYSVSQHGGLALTVGVMTLVILVFGEITPKTLAQQHAQWIAARVAGVLYLLDVVLRPVNWVLGLISRLLTRPQGPDAPVTEEDLLFMLRLAHHHAQLPTDTRMMIEAILRFQQAMAREVMVPRTMVTTADSSWDQSTIRQRLGSSVHSRFPVVSGSPDNIMGVVHAKHLLRLEPGRSWTEVVVKPLFIPETRALPDLLQDFRNAGQHLAIVLDEFGGFSGIVTLEDVLELVVGEIEDEFDQELESAVVADGDGWSVPGYLSMRRLESLLQRAVRQPEDIDSVGGLAGSLLKEGTNIGAVVEWDGLTLEVTETEGSRPTRILVRPADTAGSAESSAPAIP
jgi:putative hemolysin